MGTSRIDLGRFYRPWMEDARCSEENASDFFQQGSGTDQREGRVWRGTLVALANCAICPVQRDCLELALDRPVDGIWAGTLPRDRRDATPADVDDLLEVARQRAVDAGLAPFWAVA